MADNAEPNDPAPTDPGGRLDPKQLLAKEGDWESVARSLAYKVDEVERDNAKYRAEIREMKKDAPPEGAVILSGDDLNAYNALKELGTADELQAKLDQATEDATYRAEKEREAEFARVADAAGVSLAALQSAKGSDAVQYEIETVKEDGEDKHIVYVKPDEDGERVAFEDYVDEHWAAIKPALYTTTDTADGGAQQNGTPQRPSVRFVTQTPGGRPPAPKGPDKDAAVKRKREEYAAMI